MSSRQGDGLRARLTNAFSKKIENHMRAVALGYFAYNEQRLHRSMKEALRQLKELQTERRERQKAEMDDAIRLPKTRKTKGLPPDPQEAPEEAAAQASVRCEDGIRFVYASAEIIRESARRDRVQDALLAEEAGFKFTEYERRTSNLRIPSGISAQNAEIRDSGMSDAA